MLIGYFLKNFYKNFLMSFGVISFVLVASNVFVRLPAISSLYNIPIIFWTMVPLMAVFSMPIASGLAVQLTIGSHLISDEILFFKFSNTAYKALIKAVFIFSLSLTVVYIPLVFDWAPRSYLVGKKLLLQLAQEKFFQVEANKFHSLFGKFTFFFKNKSVDEKGIYTFHDILLIVHHKEGEKIIFSAKEGVFVNNSMILKHGSISTEKAHKSHFASFEETDFNFNSIVKSDETNGQLKHMKFCSWKKLLDLKSSSDEAFIEWQKRLTQVLWLLFFPFLAFLIIFVFGKQKSNLLLSLVSSSFLFLILYISTSVAQLFISTFYVALACLYLPLIFLISFLFWLAATKR
jgi:lipopolysaccharide export LptBFGC system permease protein LptF